MQGYDLRVTLAISGVLLAIAAWLWWWVEGLTAFAWGLVVVGSVFAGATRGNGAIGTGILIIFVTALGLHWYSGDITARAFFATIGSYFLVMMAIGGPMEAMKDNRALERRLTKGEET